MEWALLKLADKYSDDIKDAIKSVKRLEPYIAHPYPLQENFTGREKERKMLSEWFERGGNRCWP